MKTVAHKAQYNDLNDNYDEIVTNYHKEYPILDTLDDDNDYDSLKYFVSYSLDEEY